MNSSLLLPWNALDHLGGFASRAELMRFGCSPAFIDLSVWYRRILPLRRGWYGSRGLDPLVLRALRIGGRLACASAVAWYEGRAWEGPVHVLVPYGASRLGQGAVVHGSRRAHAGSRTVVALEVARRQAATCRISR